MNLIIVESPTKAKTIGKFLGPDYQIESSFGHIRDLPKKNLGIDIERDFEPKYVVPTKSRKTVAALKKSSGQAERVILATDEDREGEAIAWHLVQALGLNEIKNQKSKIKNIERIVFHEITKSTIEKSLKNPREIDQNLVDAQQARRVLDRLVGYKLSPFLWKKIMGGLSAGRVQSVAVRLIAERENEIKNFKPEEYWSIEALLQSRGLARTGTRTGADILANLVKIDGKALEKFDIKNKEQADKIAEELKSCEFKVLKIEKREINKNPPPPFITSTLQQEAVKRLGFSSKKTMFIAQRLYERGLITYMRTDSVNLSQEALTAAKAWLQKNLGDQYASEAPRIFTSQSRLAQEAHEAIRPTDVNKQTEELEDEGDKKLYRLIWQRFTASQMPPAKISTVTVEILAASHQSPITNYQLRATGQQILFDGYLKIWPQKFSEKELPPLAENENLDLKEVKPLQHFTEPPPRYSEASLIKTLEEYGIGRPSTYAPIISVIQERNYVNKEKGRFYPTETGELVNKVLTEHFPQIVDIGFTAGMEEDLDKIAEGKEKWQEVIGNFYGPFAKNLAEKYEEVSKKELTEEKTDQLCEKCGKLMIIKYGRFGKFLACSGFPECKNTKPLNQQTKEPPKTIGLKCPKCNQGEIVERRVSRGRARGKIFWGCSRYPDCDYASWTNPVNKAKIKLPDSSSGE
jgi:DNA topoisomerase-1